MVRYSPKAFFSTNQVHFLQLVNRPNLHAHVRGGFRKKIRGGTRRNFEFIFMRCPFSVFLHLE